MEVGMMIEALPESVKMDIVDFQDVLAKDGRRAVRITLDRLLSDEEMGEMELVKGLVGPYTATYRWATEIQVHYFYLAV